MAYNLTGSNACLPGQQGVSVSLSLEGAARQQSSCWPRMVHLVNCRRVPPLRSAIREPLPSRGSGPSWGIQRGIVGYVEGWITAPGRNFMRRRVASGREQPLEGDPILGLEKSARKAIKKPHGMPPWNASILSWCEAYPDSCSGCSCRMQQATRPMGGVRIQGGPD